MIKRKQEDPWILSSEELQKVSRGARGGSSGVISHTAELNFLASTGNDIISRTGESLARQKQASSRKSCHHFKSLGNINAQIVDHESRQTFVVSTCPSKMPRHLSGSGLVGRRPLASKFSCGNLTASNVSLPNDCTERHCKG